MFTSLSSLRAHHRRGAVRWDLVRGIAPGIVAGGLLAGYLGSFWSGMGKSDFFMMIAIIAALAGVAILAVARPVTGMLKH